MRRFLRWANEWFFGGDGEGAALTVTGSLVMASCPNCMQSYVRGHADGRKEVDSNSWKAGYQFASEQADAEMLQAHEAAAAYQESLVEFAVEMAVTA